MKGIKGFNLNNLAKRLRDGKNKNVAVFAFFLLLSFTFWYLNALGKEVDAEIRYPVNFINLPEDKVVDDEQPTSVYLSLRGSGYSILKLKLASKRNPVIIDISNISYKRVPGRRDLNYYIVTSGISSNLAVTLRTECVITSVKPDTIYFTINEIATESASVTSDN